MEKSVAIAWGAAGLVFLVCLAAKESYGLAESTAQEGSNAQAVQVLGEHGSGVKVGLIGLQNVYFPHEAFAGVTIVNYSTAGLGLDPNWHDTLMAGIIASNGGATHPNDIGVAPGVEIHSVRIGDVLEAFSILLNAGCRVIVTGVAWGSDPDGDSAVSVLYDYYAYSENVVLAIGTGNNDDYVFVPGDAYNAITTGGLVLNDSSDQFVYRRVGAQSIAGPTMDGRRKPEIVAPSGDQICPAKGGYTIWRNTNTYNGALGVTSWSVPHTAGVAALLLGLADDTAEANDDRNEVIKAVIVNSAFANIDDKTGAGTNPADPANVWHPERGYGRIDALRAYQTLAAGKVDKDVVISADVGWAYNAAASSQEDKYYFDLAGKRNHRFVLTATWNRLVRKIGSNYIPESESANIDLAIVGPDSLGVFSETDSLNNLEKVEFVVAQEGLYEVRIKNNYSTSRGYALAFEILAPMPADFDVDYIVSESDLSLLVGQWLTSGSNLEADLWPDNKVDLRDFGVFSQSWRRIDARYYDGG